MNAGSPHLHFGERERERERGKGGTCSRCVRYCPDHCRASIPTSIPMSQYNPQTDRATKWTAHLGKGCPWRAMPRRLNGIPLPFPPTKQLPPLGAEPFRPSCISRALGSPRESRACVCLTYSPLLHVPLRACRDLNRRERDLGQTGPASRRTWSRGVYTDVALSMSDRRRTATRLSSQCHCVSRTVTLYTR